MSTFNIAADKLGYVARTSYSSWNTSSASQGAVTGGYARVGALLFSKLREGIEWADQNITEIRLTLTFSQAGLNREKSLYLYEGTQNDLTGTGTAMRGASIGTVKTNGTAYNSTRTVYFSETENASAFANLVDWIQNGTTTTLALYVNEAASGYDWSTNYLHISAATISIDHDVKGSKGTLSADSVEAGSSITLTVEPMEADGTVTHKVQWKFGSLASSTTTLSSGTTTATYTVPLTWLNQIPNAVSGTAECVLTTLVGGVQTAQRSIPFTVTAGASVVPSFTASAAYSGTTDGYYQYIGAAVISFDSVSLPYGATAVSYRITGPEGVDSASSSVTTEKFQNSGTHTYTLTLTDSRGRSTTKTVSITVTAVAAPQITAFSVQRYSSRISDSGATVYEASTDGNKVWVTISASIDRAGGNNTPTAYILYGPEDGSQTRKDITWSSTASAYTATNNRTLITATIPLDSAYDFELVVSDKRMSVTASARVEQSWAILHMAGNGAGVAVGMYSTGTAEKPRFESAWEASFYGGIEGVTNYTAEETLTGGTWIDGRPIYRKTISGSGSAGQAVFAAGESGLVLHMSGIARVNNSIWGPLPVFVNPGDTKAFAVVAYIGSDNGTITFFLGTSTTLGAWYLTVEYVKD